MLTHNFRLVSVNQLVLKTQNSILDLPHLNNLNSSEFLGRKEVRTCFIRLVVL